MPAATTISTLLGPSSSSKLTLIEDSVEQGSIQLIQEAVWLALTRGSGPVLVVQGEGILRRWSRPDDLGPYSTRLHVLDLAYTSWSERRKEASGGKYASCIPTQLNTVLATLTSTYQHVKPSTIIIDDLSRLLSAHPTSTFRSLRDLLASSIPVDIVAAYHEDILSPRPSPILPIATLASVHIRIRSVRAEQARQYALQQGMGEEELGPPGIGLVTGNSTTDALLHITVMKRSGKKSVEDLMVEYENDGRIKGLTPVTEASHTQHPSPSQDESKEQVPEPSSVQASFNLGLTEQEREARDNTVLPYTQITESDKATFYYQPDEGDDFDDEDPDEDLDI
ncbi:Elongator complex protein 5 [Piptocephalis cylindrospora]|uniref:Elongator complex protein 5 n=1 Tax=Piptocephalis cylindrospora TaxID=1907219 RepID=A0A4P9Y3Y1_9FUNG|nr:Elongator complex protein 5 [Piptocephalis cylindrospora]|eukprot:RKP13605.1 Elongator complex protein 5 [Piptocephalis cylindrospora]